MSKVIKCFGCGAKLQTENKDHVGFALSLEHEYCQSCYRLMHYGDVKDHFHPEDLPQLSADALIVMIGSILHIDMIFSYPVYRFQPNAKFVYIINQIDLLPQSTKLSLLLENVTKKARLQKIPYEDIILMSAKNHFDMEHLRGYLQMFRQKDIYLLGVQNSGKTTIFKALTKEEKALAFKKAGLTQEALSAPFGNHMIYDMPGLYQKGYLHTFLTYDQYKDLIPDQEIKPRIYMMHQKQSLFLEGMIAVTHMSLQAKSYVFYLHQNLRMHKTNEDKINGLIKDKVKQFKIYAETYETKQFKLPDGKYQITFADMGMLHIVGPANLKITYPKGMHLSLSEALFK